VAETARWVVARAAGLDDAGEAHPLVAMTFRIVLLRSSGADGARKRHAAIEIIDL
jgi:hypothetical protein